MKLLDLLTQMDGSTDPKVWQSSSDLPSWKALRMAEANKDTSLIDEISGNLSGLSDKKLMHCVKILSHTYVNIRHAECIPIIKSIWNLKEWETEQLMYLNGGATVTKSTELWDLVIGTLKVSGVLHYPEAIEYLGVIRDEKSISKLHELLANDCSGNCNPFYVCIELGNIGNPSSIPILEMAIQRNSKGRKGWQKDVVAYAKQAIDEIRGVG